MKVLGVYRPDSEAARALHFVLLLLIIPFTLIVILPTNKRLESQELNWRSEEAGLSLQRWGRLHAVRSLLSGVAFLIFLFTLIGRG